MFFYQVHHDYKYKKSLPKGGLIFQLMNNNYQVVLTIETLVCPVVALVPAVISPKAVTYAPIGLSLA